MTPAKTSCAHDYASRPPVALGAAAGLPRPARHLADRGADPEHRELSDRNGSDPRDPFHPWRQGIPDQYSCITSPYGDWLQPRRYRFDPARADDGPQPRCGVVFQSAADGDLSGAEGGADADHHALARRR